MTWWLNDEEELPPDRFAPKAPTLAAAPDVDPEDLVVCPTCRTVQSLHTIEDVETRKAPASMKDVEAVEGVFCGVPGCGQFLLDRQGLIRHARKTGRRAAPEDEASPPEPASTG